MKLKTVTLRGYKSIAKLESFKLNNLVLLVLHNYGYLQGLRERVVGQVLALAKLMDGNSAA